MTFDLARTVGELRAYGRRRLSQAGFEIDRREAALILSRVLGWNEAQILARPEWPVTRAQAQCYRALLERRSSGEPVAYLFGEREFYGRPFAVDRRVLVPRPETEHLVEAALARAPAGGRVVDVGCGSGCIALTLALERPDLSVVAVDVSIDALVVAASNRRRHRLDSHRASRRASRVALLAGNLASAFAPRSLDLIVANLPYVAPQDRKLLSREILDYEPEIALFAEDGGLAAIQRLLEQCKRLLREEGAVLLEIGAGQLARLKDVALGFRLARVHRDYAGHERIVELETGGQ